MSIMSMRMPAAWVISRCEAFDGDQNAGGVDDSYRVSQDEYDVDEDAGGVDDIK